MSETQTDEGQNALARDAFQDPCAPPPGWPVCQSRGERVWEAERVAGQRGAQGLCSGLGGRARPGLARGEAGSDRRGLLLRG